MATKAKTKKIELTAPVYSSDGKKIDQISLDADVFGVTVKPIVMTRAVIAQEAQSRSVIAHTKTRAERRGGGRKPWKQKGTGRARQGSIRSPQWKKGGVVFGPRNVRTFEQKLNRKERRQAIRGALSQHASAKDGILILEDLKLENIKTKPVAALFSKLPVTRTSLLVIAEHDPKVELSVRNVEHVKAQLASNLNVRDLLQYRHLVMPRSALELLVKTYKE
jgi:large subunit ribosomal protein L4